MGHDTGGTGTSSQKRRAGRAFHHAGGLVRKRIDAAAARRGFAEPDVLMRWPEIVGADLAEACQPIKVSYGARRGALGATLLVEASGARATEVEHLAPAIVERVNSHYGYRAVIRLRITQATGTVGLARGFAEEREAFRSPPPTTPSVAYEPDALERARALAADVENPGLRDALIRLGARVLAGPPARKGGSGR